MDEPDEIVRAIAALDRVKSLAKQARRSEDVATWHEVEAAAADAVAELHELRRRLAT